MMDARISDFASKAHERLAAETRSFARALVGEADAMPQADALARQCLERAPANAESALVREKLFAEIVRLNRLRIRIEPHEGALRPVVGAARDIVAFVQALPLEEREALLVVALGGFSYGAAARILAAPRAVVVTRLARARAALDAAERGPVARVGHLRIVK